MALKLLLNIFTQKMKIMLEKKKKAKNKGLIVFLIPLYN